jgi:hypothetical protein
MSVATLAEWAKLLAEKADTATGEPGAHSITPVVPVGRRIRIPRSSGRDASNIGIKPRGICRKCGGEYPLNKDGLIAKHGKTYGIKAAKRCPGSRMYPRPSGAGETAKPETEA